MQENLICPARIIKSAMNTAGTNLFHSFQQFNIHSGESATFTGPDSVQNIISRVTGGDPSWIDGKLRSEIPGADMYLLNPAGMMFGPGASLDLGGSFHVSTADYLGLENGERFYTMPQENEVMSVAAPTAFGFLNNEIGSISFEGRGEITEQEWKDNPSGLHVSEGKTISLIGGISNLQKALATKPRKLMKMAILCLKNFLMGLCL
ncbi:filamentous hemagglutinin N-terminal domain-containing protein [Desulfococcaceae bacterium HSG8]|nr:filamentous hemagglutinin N-terminal domain-containing protein [Desulfococcaceae bacterium HSG8]